MKPTTSFSVLSGRLTIRLRDGDVVLAPGDLFIVPVGVEHQPFADEETHLLLIEPSGTPNSGDPENRRTAHCDLTGRSQRPGGT